jgi:hypothetical protein
MPDTPETAPGRRRYHLRPEPPRRTDFMGFSSAAWMALGWILLIVVVASIPLVVVSGQTSAPRTTDRSQPMSTIDTNYDDVARDDSVPHDRARELLGPVMGFVAVTDSRRLVPVWGGN